MFQKIHAFGFAIRAAGGGGVVFGTACVSQFSKCVDQVATLIYVVGPKEAMWLQFTSLLTKLWTFNTPYRIILIGKKGDFARFASIC